MAGQQSHVEVAAAAAPATPATARVTVAAACLGGRVYLRPGYRTFRQQRDAGAPPPPAAAAALASPPARRAPFPSPAYDAVTAEAGAGDDVTDVASEWAAASGDYSESDAVTDEAASSAAGDVAPGWGDGASSPAASVPSSISMAASDASVALPVALGVPVDEPVAMGVPVDEPVAMGVPVVAEPEPPSPMDPPAKPARSRPAGADGRRERALCGLGQLTIAHPMGLKVELRGVLPRPGLHAALGDAAAAAGGVDACYLRHWGDEAGGMGAVVWFRDAPGAAAFEAAVNAGGLRGVVGGAATAARGKATYCREFLRGRPCRGGFCPHVHAFGGDAALHCALAVITARAS